MSNSVYNMPDEEVEKYSILHQNNNNNNNNNKNKNKNNIRDKISTGCYWSLVISISGVIIGSTLWCIIKYYK